jgi:hypothetical protein
MDQIMTYITLDISEKTRKRAKLWHDKTSTREGGSPQPLSSDERFFGFLKGWRNRTPLEKAMLKAFQATATAYRIDFLIDLQFAGLTQHGEPATGDSALLFWCSNQCGSWLVKLDDQGWLKRDFAKGLPVYNLLDLAPSPCPKGWDKIEGGANV